MDGIGPALAAEGYLNPILAALIHVTSELVFILYFARLLSGTSSAALHPVAEEMPPGTPEQMPA